MKNQFKSLFKNKNAHVKIFAIILFLLFSLLIFISSSLTSPQQIGYFTSTDLDGPYSVFVLGNYTYIASYNSGSLTVINTTDKTFPEQIGYLVNASSLNGAYSV